MRDESPARGGGWRRRLILALTVLAPLLLVASVGLSVIGYNPLLLWYQVQTVDTLRATDARSYSVPAQLAPFDKTVKDAAAVQALYRAAFDQPAPSLAPHGCALGTPVVYHLAFSRAGHDVATIEIDLAGCPSLSLAGLATRTPTASFFQQVADTLHVDEQSLWQPFVFQPAPALPQITVKVERIDETATTHVAPFARTISDGAVGFALDNDVIRYSAYGGPQPPAASDCPPNDGVLYRLTFYDNGAPAGVTDIEATGCQMIFTYDGFPPIRHISSPSFWDALAQALGVPVASLGAGPIAPYWTSAPTVHAR